MDEASLASLLRRNKFATDAVGVQGCTNQWRSASNAIAERGDLTDPRATCIVDIAWQDEAATDLKYTSWSRYAANTSRLSAMAQSGPTYQDGLPVFVWSNSSLRDLVPHTGQPDVWQFGVVEMAFAV